MKKFLLLFLTAAFSLSFRATAHSHRPRLVEGNSSHDTAYRIQDAEISWALYGDLETTGRVEYFTFAVEGGSKKVSPELLVPDESLFEDFAPTFVIYGSSIIGAAPVEVRLPPGRGAVTAKPRWDEEFEGFTRKSFRKVASMELTLAPGEYGVAVFTRSGKTGEYVFVIGTAEEFDLDDFGPMVTGCGTIFY